VVIGGDSQKKREEDLSSKKLQTTSHSSSFPEAHQASPSVTTGQREPFDEVSEITDALRELPTLPVELIDAKTDRAIHDGVTDFWETHELKRLLGDQSLEVAKAVIGLVWKARRKDDPRAWIEACLRNGVMPTVVADGAALLRRLKTQQDRPYVAHG
jgi:hypothetical protein